MVVGIIARGAVKRLGLFGQRPEVNSFPIALHFAEADRFRQIVNGDNVDFVLPFAIPLIPDFRELPAFRELVLVIVLKRLAAECPIIAEDDILQAAISPKLYQRLVLPDEPEPESEEIVLQGVMDIPIATIQKF